MKRDAGHHLSHILRARFHHQIPDSTSAPKTPSRGRSIENRAESGQGIHDEEMSANMGAVPVQVMGKEDRLRLLIAEDLGDDANGLGPGGLVLLAGLDADSFQAVRLGLDQAKPHILAGSLNS